VGNRTPTSAPFRSAWLILFTSSLPCLASESAITDQAPAVSRWSGELLSNIRDPWFVFGMGAQGLFFLRFMVQWIVSERRKRSSIPIAFWYLSLAGAVATLVYATHEAQPVFMLGQLLACLIYVRNLVLIHRRATHRKLAGLPPETS